LFLYCVESLLSKAVLKTKTVMSEANERPFLSEGASPGLAGGACDDSNPIFHPKTKKADPKGQLYFF